MNFKKITETDLLNRGVLGLPDTPGLTTRDMQAKFDELVREVMVPKFNALMDELSVIANINEVTQTVKNTETSIPTGKAVTGYVADTQKNMALVPVFKSKGEFPEKGDTNRIYIDDTVSPRLLYTWSAEEGYVLTGGEGSSLIILPLTYAEYVALPEEEKMRDDVIYEITDRDYGVRFGESDISKIGDGSVTGAISELDYSKADASKKTNALDVEDVAYTSDIPEDADDGDAKISMIGGTTKKSKNLIPYPYRSASFEGSGITWTVKDDGTVTANGTATAKTEFFISHRTLSGLTFPKGDYVLSGCPSGGASTKYFIGVMATVNGSASDRGYDYGSGLNVSVDGTETGFGIILTILSGVTVSNLVFKPMLRLATDTDDTYEPYFAGLRSAPVTEVESVGVNIFGGDALADKLVEVASATKNESEGTVTFSASKVSGKIIVEGFFKENTQYTLMFCGMNTKEGGSRVNLFFEYTDGTRSGTLQFPEANEASYFVYTTSADKTLRYIMGSNQAASTILYYDQCGIFEGALTIDDFKPYVAHTLPIPDAVQALDGYGDGISDTVYNYVDWEKKQYVKRVGKVDMGTLSSWKYNTSYTYPHFHAGVPSDNINFESTDKILLCEKYKTTGGKAYATFRGSDYDGYICNLTNQGTGTRIALQDSAYTDVETFKNAMSGVMLYVKVEVLPKISDKAFAMVMATGIAMIDNKPELIGDILKNDMVSALLSEKNGLYQVDALKNALVETVNQYGELKIKIPGIKFLSPEEKELTFSAQDINVIYDYMTGAR